MPPADALGIVTSFERVLAAARGHSAARRVRRRRVVLRMDGDTIADIDALRARFKASRADLVRAFVALSLSIVREPSETPPAGTGEAAP